MSEETEVAEDTDDDAGAELMEASEERDDIDEDDTSVPLLSLSAVVFTELSAAVA